MSDWPSLCSYAFFKETLVPIGVGLIGFGGVAATLWYNAYLLRVQQADKLTRKQDSLKKALLAELQINHLHFRHATDDANKLSEERQYLLIPKTVSSSIYEANVSNFGLLTVDEVAILIMAYSAIKGLPFFASEYGINHPEDHESAGYYVVHINPRGVVNLQGKLTAHTEIIWQAIELLQGMLRDPREDTNKTEIPSPGVRETGL